MKERQNKLIQPQQEGMLVRETITDNRRRILKASLASGVVLSSTQWAKPIVNAVMLPAHAQTSVDCQDLTVSFSATEFQFDSDADNDLQSSTMQITNTSASSISPSATVTSSSKGETYSVIFNPDILAAGATGDITLSADFTGLSTFCTAYDATQELSESVGVAGSEDCPLTSIADVPSIRIDFGC